MNDKTANNPCKAILYALLLMAISSANANYQSCSVSTFSLSASMLRVEWDSKACEKGVDKRIKTEHLYKGWAGHLYLIKTRYHNSDHDEKTYGGVPLHTNRIKAYYRKDSKYRYFGTDNAFVF